MLSRNLQSRSEYNHAKIKDLRHVSLLIKLTVNKAISKFLENLKQDMSREAKREWRRKVDSIFLPANIPLKEITIKCNVGS